MPDSELRVTQHGRRFQHELLLEGEWVSGLGVYDLQMRVGVATVRMGGIGGVATHTKHRNRGYARRVLEQNNVWMAAQGFDCTLLFGIPDFYHKFGYEVCLPDCRWEMRTRDAERATATLAVRPYIPDDRPVLQEIYAANNAGLTGSIVREEATPWFGKGSNFEIDAEAFVFTDPAGTIVAYAARDVAEERVIVCEVGMRQPQYGADVVRWAAERAIQLRVEKLNFIVPPDSLFGLSLMQYGAEQKLFFPRNQGGMGRILNLDSFFEKTLPEWTRRAGALRSTASLRLETDIGSLTLRWTGETMEKVAEPAASGRVQLPQSRLMQLVMGYSGSELALTFPEVQAEGDLSLLHTLFPRRLSFMLPTDHF